MCECICVCGYHDHISSFLKHFYYAGMIVKMSLCVFIFIRIMSYICTHTGIFLRFSFTFVLLDFVPEFLHT